MFLYLGSRRPWGVGGWGGGVGGHIQLNRNENQPKISHLISSSSRGEKERSDRKHVTLAPSCVTNYHYRKKKGHKSYNYSKYTFNLYRCCLQSSRIEF